MSKSINRVISAVLAAALLLCAMTIQVRADEDGESGKYVSDYKEHGCYDVADLNGDFGQEWLSLYTVKSLDKGKPILADSLKLQYGSDKQSEGTSKSLRSFEYTYAADLGDTAYSYNNDKDGIYFFWEEDVNAESSKTASVFSAGQLALAGAGGLILGVLCATLVLLSRRKKEPEQEDTSGNS